MVNFIKNILVGKSAKSGKMAPSVLRERISPADKRVKVKEGTEWAVRKYGKTFEILRDYDRS